ncbi:MAG: amidohydrolase family protein [Candidatus Binatus sp.]|jgi:predicted TIM-barrel fold metal-dependent hydrolase
MTPTLENSLLKREVVTHRTAETSSANDAQARNDFKIVSADGHWEVAEDIWYENFPTKMRDKAPRVWFDRGFWHQGYPEALVAGSELAFFEEMLCKFIPNALGAGAWDMTIRNKDFDLEGIQKELIYPQSLLAFIRHPDLEVQELIYWYYNEYIARVCARYPDRYYGVGVCSNWWEPSKARQAVKQIVDLGLKTMMLPTVNVGRARDGRTLSYADKSMDALWDEIGRAELPVSFHVGETIDFRGRGGFLSTGVTNLAAARRPLSELIFGGVFDRHPNLRIVFAEFGVAWVPVFLQDAEHAYDIEDPILDELNSRPVKRPTHYWHNNCYSTFQNDRLGLKLLEYVGEDRVMWAQDYPHNEGTFGYSWSSRDDVIAATTNENARKILGETAVQLYGL